MKLKIAPHNLFLLIASVLFFFYNSVTPPLQSPDEFDHFRRSYSLSEGHFIPVLKDHRLGDSVPSNFKCFAGPYRLAASNLKYTINDSVAAYSARFKLDEKFKDFEDFPNTSNYSVVSYLPQVITMAVMKPCNPRFYTLYTACRAVTFLTWMLAFYFFIKMVPVYKWFFFFIALLPMNLYQANSFSADTMTNVLAFLFMGLVLKYAFDDRIFSYKRLIILLVFAVLLSLAKVVYVGLVLSVLIIPVKKYTSVKHKVFFSLLVCLAGFVAAGIWSATVTNFNLTYNEYNVLFRDNSTISHCANLEQQKQYMLSHPTYIFTLIYNSIFNHPYTFLNGFIGNFGNSDIPLSRSITLLSYAVVFLLLLCNSDDKILSWRNRIILAFAAFSSFVFLLISQHLTWDCLAEGVVDIVQGRYLTPVLPFILLLIPPIKFFKLNYVFMPAIGVCCLINWSGINRINERYFKDSYDDLTKFYCSSDTTNQNGLMLTTDTAIVLEGAKCRQKIAGNENNLCVVLSKKCPYGYTYKFKNLRYGDLVDVKADAKGGDLQFVVTVEGKSCGNNYSSIKIPHFNDTVSWHRIHTAVTITGKCDSSDASIYLWNPDTTGRVFIDNVEYSIKRFKDNYLDKSRKRLSLFK